MSPVETSLFEFFSLKFRNISSGQTRDVKFRIESHKLAQKWASMLKEVLSSTNDLEKSYLLHGWLSGSRNCQFLCSELNRNIQVINKHFKSKPQGLSYFIEQVFDPLTVDQIELNRIHHDFEMLIGQVWKVSEYYKASPPLVRHSIRQLNNLCHETESYLGSQRSLEEGRCSAHLIASIAPKRCVELTEDDKKHFELFFGFGEVRLHYAQLGKAHLEAYNNRDTMVFDDNITELRYLSGEFDISFSDRPHPVWADQVTSGFKDWLKSKNIDPEGNFGFARVAILDFEQFENAPSVEILRTLFKYDDVCEISLFGDGQFYRKEYPNSWRDCKFETALIESDHAHAASFRAATFFQRMKDRVYNAFFQKNP